MDSKEANRRVIEQFRAGGEIDGMHRERLILLTTVGARTGRRHTTPMMFHGDGDRLLVMASNAGAPKYPDWYRNVTADPHVVVEIGDERYDALATPTTGGEYERLWSTIKEKYPFFADHEVKAGRPIPVIAILRAGPAG
jgi:deazaflavin-dependent oxidoreductase (nitroreductase family)